MISSVISAIIEEVKKVIPCYSQLPLTGVNYPFAVIEETISNKKPLFECNIIIDIWNNKLNDDLLEVDTLAKNLYDICITKSNVWLYGKWETSQNIVTSEEGLTRKQIRLSMKGSFRNNEK